MRVLDINEYLCGENVWARRLLGFEPYQQERSAELIAREYDRELYGKLLRDYGGDLERLRRIVLHPPSDEVVVSMQDRLIALPYNAFKNLRTAYIHSVLDRHCGDSLLCELGAGFGQNFLLLGRDMYGGECSQDAVRLAHRLGLDVQVFDFSDLDSYSLIRPHTVIFTSHAIEQVRDAKVVIDALRAIRDRVDAVIHLEPVCRDVPVSFWDLVRNRYMMMNDYCCNLLQVLQEECDVEIIEFERDIQGLNPLNPSSLLVWRFT
jgi:hypothetical protein